jgi:hypothetical protein
MAEDDINKEQTATKAQERSLAHRREAERRRRQNRALHAFADAFKTWAKAGDDTGEDQTLQTATVVAWTVQERCSGHEALALSVIIRTLEDALSGKLWSSLRTSKDDGRPFSQMERAAVRTAISYISYADAGLIDITVADAISIVARIYGVSRRTVERWWKSARDSEEFYDVSLVLLDGLTEEETKSRRKSMNEDFLRELQQIAPFARRKATLASIPSVAS